jgi:hypothetical protein
MNNDILVNNSILEVKKYQLFNDTSYQLLENSTNFIDTLTTLGFGLSNDENIYILSTEELLKTRDLLLSECDKKSADMMLLYLDYDISNIRDVLKTIKLGYKSSYFSKLGLLDKETLINVFNFNDVIVDSNYKELFDSLLNEQFASLEDITNKTAKLAYSFIYNKVYNYLSKSGRLYFHNLIDIKNILLIIKCREQNKDLEFFLNNFIPYGYIDKVILIDNYNLEYQNMFKTTYFGKISNVLTEFSINNNYEKLEYSLYNLLINEINDSNLPNNTLFQYYLLSKQEVSKVISLYLGVKL